MSRTMIEARKVGKEYQGEGRRLVVLENAEFTVGEGDFLALVGRSGTGKTTVLNLLGGLDRPNCGEILFDGVHLERMPDLALSRFRNASVGFVFQTFSLQPMRSALENVMVPMLFNEQPMRAARQRAAEALEEVGLGDKVRVRVSNLSGGQRQRVAIARAVVNRPRLLLADEPTGHLDTQTSVEIFELLRQYNQRHGTTIVVVSHDPLVTKYNIPLFTVEGGQIVAYAGTV